MGSEPDHLPRRPLGLHGLYGFHDGPHHQYHARAAAVRSIIDLVVLALGPVADVGQVHLDQPGLDRTLEQALP